MINLPATFQIGGTLRSLAKSIYSYKYSEVSKSTNMASSRKKGKCVMIIQIRWFSKRTCPGYAWWRHQMETFSALLAIYAGNSPVSGALIFSLICVWINGRVNNREAGDLRRYRAHYDVSVMGFDIVLTCVPVTVSASCAFGWLTFSFDIWKR